MKCIFCNAKFAKAEVTESGAKLCPKCKAIIGSTAKKPSPPPSPPPIPLMTPSYMNEWLMDKIVELNPKSFNTDRPKDTKGKYQPHLVLGSLTQAVARVREYGVKKYRGENGWKQQTPQDYMDAVGRHYDECRNDPYARDEESGLLHIAQIATDAMFIIEMLREQGENFDIMKEPICPK